MNPMIVAMRALPQRVLQDLAASLRSGRIGANATPFQVRHAVPSCSEAAASELCGLLGHGLASSHAAVLVDLLCEACGNKAPGWELVTSGPDEAGAARDTGVVLREMFAGADERILVVGFAVHQGRRVFAELAQRMDQNPELRVTLCLDIARSPGDTSTQVAILRRFAERFFAAEWPGVRRPDIYYDPRALAVTRSARASLHAKCVAVDGAAAFVGSANFTEAAQVRNIETGILLRSPAAATAIEAHFAHLIQRGFLLPLL